jgi:uncharacterized membrane protein
MVVGLFIIAAAIFVAIDAVWLSTVARSVYVAEIGPLLLAKPNLGVAAGFYLLYLVGLMAFVILPAARANAPLHALLYGALFGLVAYATYDLTNLATMKGFTARIAMIDMAWGAALSASVSAGTIVAARLLRLI